MATTLEYLIALLILLPVLRKLVNLAKYINQAKRTGLPYVIVPILESELLAKLSTPILRKVYRDRLTRNEGWPRWCRFFTMDWAWEDKRRAHEEYGDVFLVVSPKGIICYTADAHMCWDVMQRRHEFTKPKERYEVINIYGTNVITAEGKDYNFHFRITAPPFNESSGVNDLVWKESAHQTRQLMDSWSQDGSIRDISLDISRLTLGVISYAAFGEQLDFTAAASDLKSTIPPGYKLSLLHALHTVVKNMIQILVLPEWVMRMTGMSHLVLARTELEKHMRGMIQSETAMLEKDVEYKSARAPGTLLTSLLRASVKEGPTQGDGRKHAFTEDEVLGNVFIFFVAGLETSANALIYALITLAIRPDLQDKIMAEIDSVYEEAHSAGRTELTYADDFEKLEYTFGFMYEIFRLYPAVFYLVKKVSKPTYITTYPEDESTPRQYLLPANCTVHLNANGVHYHKRYWPEPSEIKPERWMTNEPWAKGHVGNPGDDNRKPDASKKARQVKGTFLFFSGGARACLGRKIAQAVFMSLMSTLLRTYRVKLAEGLRKEVVKREIDTLSRGGITLAPAKYVKLVLERR